MYRIQTYSNSGDELFKFSFASKPEITDPFITLATTQSRLTFGNVPFVMYDDLITLALWGSWQNIREDIIDEAFKQKKRILVILTSDNEPLLFTTGKTLSIENKEDIKVNYTNFLVDGKNLVISNLNFMIISPNRDMSI